MPTPVIPTGANPVTYLGAVGDGASHPLSSITSCQGQSTAAWTLAQWRVLFPSAQALTDEIDEMAIQRWCDLNTRAVAVDIPPGIFLIKRGVTTGQQSVCLRGAGVGVTELWAMSAGMTLWTHGTAASPANGIWTASDLMIRPKAICAAIFNVRFSGNQPVWCHVMRDIQCISSDITNYFENAFITRNIKRGLDWKNLIVFGKNFAILTTNAFEFPANVDNSLAGNSYNFINCMTVGYNFGWNFGFDGFTSSNNHMHEEAQFYNCQSYSGRGFFQALNGNFNYAPADNWTFNSCGWQGTGPGFNIQYLEEVRIRDTLLVNDDTTSPDHVTFASILNCDSVYFDQNELFSTQNSSGITAIYVAGSRTRNVYINRNDIVNYATWNEFVYVANDVPAIGVEERATTFTGTGSYTHGKFNDASGLAVSETRAREKADLPNPATTPIASSVAVDVTSGGDITYNAVFTTITSDGFGNTTVYFPDGLFRSIKSVTPNNHNINKSTSWVVTAQFNTGGVTVRYPAGGIPAGTSVDTHIVVIGR